MRFRLEAFNSKSSDLLLVLERPDGSATEVVARTVHRATLPMGSVTGPVTLSIECDSVAKRIRISVIGPDWTGVIDCNRLDLRDTSFE
jgi:hypothetical protein